MEGLRDRIGLMRLVGLSTWAFVGMPLVVEAFRHGALDERRLPSLAAYLIFGVAFLLNRGCSVRQRFALILLCSVTAEIVAVTTSNGFGGVLLVISAAQVGAILPFATSLLWALAQAVVMAAGFALRYPLGDSLLIAGAYLGFQIFGVVTTHVAQRESAARDELALLNAELRATRELVVESSRIAERLRISRELHDVLGHHLTALSLNLEVASHLSEGASLDEIRKAQAIARSLLSEVRGVVSTVRGDGAVDLALALRRMAEGIPAPRIHVDVPEALSIEDPVRVHTLLRSAQEIVTNAIRHAGAANLWLEVSQRDGELILSARDDGSGTRSVRMGNGLNGMRERLEEVGGRLVVDSAPGSGFQVTARIPETA